MIPALLGLLILMIVAPIMYAIEEPMGYVYAGLGLFCMGVGVLQELSR